MTSGDIALIIGVILVLVIGVTAGAVASGYLTGSYQQIDSLKGQLASLQAEATSLRADRTALETQNAALIDSIAGLEQQIADLKGSSTPFLLSSLQGPGSEYVKISPVFHVSTGDRIRLTFNATGTFGFLSTFDLQLYRVGYDSHVWEYSSAYPCTSAGFLSSLPEGDYYLRAYTTSYRYSIAVYGEHQ